jgi:hypothetical protein
LSNKNQAEDESIARYFFELMNLANKGIPGADQSILDACVHEQILHCLRDPMVRGRLVNENGEEGDLQEKVQVAKMYEEQEEIIKTKLNIQNHCLKKISSNNANFSTCSRSEENEKIRRFERHSTRNHEKGHNNHSNQRKSTTPL